MLERSDIGILPQHLHVKAAAGPGRDDQEASRDEHPLCFGQETSHIMLVFEAVEDGHDASVGGRQSVRGWRESSRRSP